MLYRVEVRHHLGTDIAFYTSRIGAIRAAQSYQGEPFDWVQVVSVLNHEDRGGVIIWEPASVLLISWSYGGGGSLALPAETG